jgi:hypothetical protein
VVPIWKQQCALSNALQAAILTEKIQSLTSDQIAEVEDFVEFLRLRGQERGLTCAAESASTAAFETVWSNPEDVYDAL